MHVCEQQQVQMQGHVAAVLAVHDDEHRERAPATSKHQEDAHQRLGKAQALIGPRRF